MQLNGTLYFLLFLASFYATIRFFLKARISKELIFIVYGIASFFLALTFFTTPIGLLFDHMGYSFPISAFTAWGSIITISIIMSGLMILIRNSKPEFARFPKPFVSLPILLILSYPFIAHTIILKEWLIAVYEGGSLIVAVMMHVTLNRSDKQNKTILIGLGLLLIVYVIYWYLRSYIQPSDWIWQSLFVVAIVVIANGYQKIETTERKIALEQL